MNDGAMMRCVAMGGIAAVYTVYMVTSAMATGTVPDGVVFGTVTAAMGALAGYDVAVRTSSKTTKKR